MRKKFDRQLEGLNIALIEMGAKIEGAIDNAITALMSHDVDLAREVIAGDNEIDDMEREIESICFKLILQQQPIAQDLRLISTALKMVTDMERIGDHATDVSEITLMLKGNNNLSHTLKIKEMAIRTRKMLKESIDSYVKKDLELAQQVIDQDDIVDNLFVEIKSELSDLICENKDNASEALDFLMMAKYFERIGDHAENIAEWVVFFITGKHKNKSII